MTQLIAPEVLDQVLAEVYGSVAKATPTSQQQSLAAPPTTTVTGTPAQQAAIVAGSAGLAAIGPAAAGAGIAVAGASVARALAMLAAVPLRIAILGRVIALLYAAAYLASTRAAADAANGSLPPWMATLPDNAQPQQALDQAHGGLAEILSERNRWIKEMSTTQVNRVGDAIREAMENGRPLSEARDAIDAIVNDAARALLIAETEYSRAQGIAQMETYLANGVPMLQWLAQPDACQLCLENEAASPQPTTNPQWPNGGIPVHPHERCAVAPYYPGMP